MQTYNKGALYVPLPTVSIKLFMADMSLELKTVGKTFLVFVSV